MNKKLWGSFPLKTKSTEICSNVQKLRTHEPQPIFTGSYKKKSVSVLWAMSCFIGQAQLLFTISDLVGVVGSEKSVPGTTSRRHYDLSRQMSLLRAATTTRIDEELSPGNITAIRGETALLVCTIVNIGDKSVGRLWYYYENFNRRIKGKIWDHISNIMSVF